jgi:hypothetical protein
MDQGTSGHVAIGGTGRPAGPGRLAGRTGGAERPGGQGDQEEQEEQEDHGPGLTKRLGESGDQEDCLVTIPTMSGLVSDIPIFARVILALSLQTKKEARFLE